ncbi:MAG: ATP-binding protein [Vicinamibacterales bacterium]
MDSAPSTASKSPFSDAERLRLALEAARLGDWSWDAATDIVTFSPRAADIFGMAPGLAMTWTAVGDMLHSDDRARVRVAVETALANRSDYDIEYRIATDSGERWIAARGRGTYAEDGAVAGMTGIVENITGQVRSREQLREQAGALHILNDLALVLSAELDLKHVVQALTDAATSLVGAQFGAFFYSVLDAGGGSYMLYALSGVDRRHFERLPMPRATALFGMTFRGEGIVRLADVTQDPRYGHNDPHRGVPRGHLPVRSYLAIPVISRSGEVLGGLFFGHGEPGVFTDSDERTIAGLAGQAAIAIDNARLFDAVEKARESAEIANRLKDEFLATVSHELRAPLSAVLGWAALLRTTHMDDARRARALETIERNARLQQKIVEDLLDVSRIAAGQLHLEKDPMPFRPVVESAVESIKPSAAAKSIGLTVNLGDDPAILIGDHARLHQVALNLLSNAIKFTPENGAVRVSLDVIESRVEFVVADTGVGIAPAFLPHVFERFRQEDQRATRAHGGLGLGLTIVRCLTEMHGGSVAAVSAGEGKGATFIVRLPTA